MPDRNGAWRWKDGKDMGFAAKHPTIYPKVLGETKAKGLADIQTGERTLFV